MREQSCRVLPINLHLPKAQDYSKRDQVGAILQQLSSCHGPLGMSISMKHLSHAWHQAPEHKGPCAGLPEHSYKWKEELQTDCSLILHDLK